MKDIAYPQYLLDAPFADSGNKQVIPETASEAGRASLAEGFPVVTQLPLEQGGIAPNRLDFNGILYMLSAVAFWQQSGGQWTWNNRLNYKEPCVAYYDGKLWWCLKSCGPQSGNGIKTPGAAGSEDYWQNLADMLSKSSSESSSSSDNPVGAVIMYHGITAPEGYLACDGKAFSATAYPKLAAVLQSAVTPDMRGYFVRGYDTRNSIDPDGESRAIGSLQQDAMQPISGEFFANRTVHNTGGGPQSGPFYLASGHRTSSIDGGGSTYNGIGFDSSRVTRTAEETRPRNVCLLYCIKHD